MLNWTSSLTNCPMSISSIFFVKSFKTFLIDSSYMLLTFLHKSKAKKDLLFLIFLLRITKNEILKVWSNSPNIFVLICVQNRAKMFFPFILRHNTFSLLSSSRRKKNPRKRRQSFDFSDSPLSLKTVDEKIAEKVIFVYKPRLKNKKESS